MTGDNKRIPSCRYSYFFQCSAYGLSFILIGMPKLTNSALCSNINNAEDTRTCADGNFMVIDGTNTVNILIQLLIHDLFASIIKDHHKAVSCINHLVVGKMNSI